MVDMMPAFMKSIALVFVVLVIVQDLVFIILYWRQTKYMK
jgi:hypothetical protein